VCVYIHIRRPEARGRRSNLALRTGTSDNSYTLDFAVRAWLEAGLYFRDFALCSRCRRPSYSMEFAFRTWVQIVYMGNLYQSGRVYYTYIERYIYIYIIYIYIYIYISADIYTYAHNCAHTYHIYPPKSTTIHLNTVKCIRICKMGISKK